MHKQLGIVWRVIVTAYITLLVFVLRMEHSTQVSIDKAPPLTQPRAPADFWPKYSVNVFCPHKCLVQASLW